MNLYRTVPLLIACAALLGCFQTPNELEITPAKVEIYDQGGSSSLKVRVMDKKNNQIENAKPLYRSADSSVAEVDASGKVTAQMSGKTEIIVEYKKLSKSIPVTVIIVDMLKLEFPTPGIYEAMGPENSRLKLHVIAKNEGGAEVDRSILKFASSNEKVATVDSQGELTLLGDGKTVITAEVGKKKASLEVPVTILRPSAVKVDSPKFSVGVGETAYLPITIISTKGTPLFSYPVKVEFEKEGLATANETGQVTGVAKGTTNVTVKAGEASNTLSLQVR